MSLYTSSNDRYARLRAALASVDATLHVVPRDEQEQEWLARLISELLDIPYSSGAARGEGMGTGKGSGNGHSQGTGTEFGIPRVALTSEPLLEHLDLLAALRRAGIAVLGPPTLEMNVDEAEAWKKDLAQCEIGITSAVGIAEETGTLLLAPLKPDQRAVSLLPVRHVAIVREKDVVPDIGELMRRWVRSGATRGSAVFVTGPSRTADIEKELVLGVHGPQAVDVVVLEA